MYAKSAHDLPARWPENVAADRKLTIGVNIGSASTPCTMTAMKEARQGGLKSFATVQDLMADLDADD